MKKKIIANKNIILKKILVSSFFKHQKLMYDFHIKCKDQEYWEWIIKRYDSFLNNSKKKEIIPRTIHQIWLGSKVPEKYDRWRKSWIKYNPTFKYILWDEKKILKLGLINEKQFIQAKNFGCKSDIARYEILYKFGGIYVDTDFEALKPLSLKFLSYSFIAGNIFGHEPIIANGLMMSEPKCRLLKIVIDNLKKYPGKMNADEIMKYAGPQYLTKIIDKNKFLQNILILPSDYFYPKPNFLRFDQQNPNIMVTKKTLAIHYWEASWSRRPFLLSLLIKIIKKFFK